MQTPRMILSAATLAALISTPVTAQTLAEILAPRPDTYACWQRSYSEDHLAEHPLQKVTEVFYHLSYYEMEHHEAGKGNYSFSVDFTTRERKGGAGGLCYQDDQGQVICGGDCDSGALTIRNARTEGSLLLELTSGGMTLTDCGDDTPFYLPAEPDDTLFLVHPAHCPAD